MEDSESPGSLGHWSCSKVPDSFSEVRPGPGGSHFSSMKPLMGPFFFQGNPLFPDEGGRNQFFFPMLKLPLWSSTEVGTGDLAGHLRNMHPRCSGAQKGMGDTKCKWWEVKCPAAPPGTKKTGVVFPGAGLYCALTKDQSSHFPTGQRLC